MPTLFTKIINQEIPSYRIYEDEYTYVFLTIEPLYEWHCLVVPKVEVDKRYDATYETIKHCMHSAKKIAPILEKNFDAYKVALIIEGLEVPHMHIHLVPLPQWKSLKESSATRASDEELSTTQQKILNSLWDSF